MVSRIILCLFLIVLIGFRAISAPPEDGSIFNGRDLSGWSGDTRLWRAEDGQIVGGSTEPVPHNVFLWSEVPVEDFYLSVSVKLTPDDRNSGIQFRSAKVEPSEALGYQADIGKDVWGRLHHESGRGTLFTNDRGEKAVKPGEWNHYEILAVGHQVWTAINGQIAVAVSDPQGERKGLIALQVHSGPPQQVRFKDFKLIHNPKLELAGFNAAQLKAKLEPPVPNP